MVILVHHEGKEIYMLVFDPSSIQAHGVNAINGKSVGVSSGRQPNMVQSSQEPTKIQP